MTRRANIASRSILPLVLIAAALLAAPVGAGTSGGGAVTNRCGLPALAMPSARRERQAAAVFADYRRGRRPGVAVVVTCGDRVVFHDAFGYADLTAAREVTTRTPFHLASVGKQMTAVALLTLAEEGKLRLDDPVARHVRELRGWADAVTVRQLLQHTGGIPDTYDEIPGEPTNDDALALLRRWRRLDFPPGTRHDYSNSGYDVLGSVIERVSGKSFGAFMAERLFVPLGMADTFAFDEARRRRSARALGYARKGKRFVLDDSSPLNGLHGSGSIYASVDDLARYDRALFGGEIVGAASLTELFRPTRLADGSEVPYGLGWELGTDEASRPWIGHSGAWMGFSTYWLRYPRAGLSVIVLSNDEDAPAEDLATEAAAVFLDE